MIMATQVAAETVQTTAETAAVARRRFNVDEYYAMTKAGILTKGDGIELLGGELFCKYDGRRRRFTVDEYYAMAEAGILAPDERVELLAGEIFTMAAMGNRHAFCVRWLIKELVFALGDSAILDSQNPVRLGDGSEPLPDLMVLRWQDDGYESALPGAEDVLLVIEVSDTTVGFDRRHKLPMYALNGIPEAWLWDINARQVEVHDQPMAGGYARIRTVGVDGILVPGALQHVAIPVSKAMPG